MWMNNKLKIERNMYFLSRLFDPVNSNEMAFCITCHFFSMIILYFSKSMYLLSQIYVLLIHKNIYIVVS